MIRVAVDVLGGDRGPDDIVAGASDAASPEIQPILYGPTGLDANGLPLVETIGAIGMDDHPVKSVRAKPDSSLVRAVRAVADGDADTVVSAGSTGAVFAASPLHIRPPPGVHRPGIGVVLPGRQGPTVLIDAGANADARPEHLVQFGHMGAEFAHDILGVEDPVVRLLSIGEEDEKGNQLALEGTIRTILESLRTELESSVRGRLGGLLIRDAARGIRRQLDPDTYGGAYLLGLRGLVVIAHGSSSRVAIANAIRLAARGVDHDVVPRLEARLSSLAALRQEAAARSPSS